MSKIRIFSKKSFAIGPGAQRGTDVIDSFITVPGTFQDMPEEYANDPTFQLAVKFNEITVVENANTAKAVENEYAVPVTDDHNEMSEMEAYYNKLKTMDKDATLAEAKLFDISLSGNEKTKDIKKMIMEAYKIANSEEKEEETEE